MEQKTGCRLGRGTCRQRLCLTIVLVWTVLLVCFLSSKFAAHSDATNTPYIHPDAVTLVTAFLDIGQFGKGNVKNKRDHNIYDRWATAYQHVLSPVVLYTNSTAFGRLFLEIRRHLLAVTKVVYVSPEDLWSFSLRQRIAAIYAKPGYPKHYPNTVYPDYTCLTHAKMDFVLNTIEKNYFPSRRVAWMDVGYLRNIVGKKVKYRYTLLPPRTPPLNASCVLYGKVGQLLVNLGWRDILHRNLNWIAGGFFLAERDVMKAFVMQYRKAVTSFLEQGESQVEQQIIHAMYTKEGRQLVQPSIELQTLAGGWFDSGFKCLIPTAPNNTVLWR